MSNNKRVFITGSNRGIGYTVLKEFAGQGWDIYAHARKKNVEFEDSMKLIASQYEIVINPIYFDLRDSKQISAELSVLMKSKIPIDVLVNSAGIIHGGLFQMTSVQSIRNVFDVNFFGALEVTQLLAKYMIRKKSGCIINIASIAGIDLSSGNSAYGASKAALIAFSKTLSSELSSYGVRVNVVAPSLTNTEMADSAFAKKEKEILQGGNSPFQRLALPEEIAHLVLFLSSEKASFINGQVIRIDGGNKFL